MPKKKSEQLKEICVSIGTKIRNRRFQVGMTQKVLASKISLSLASISNIEKGKQSVSAEKLWQLAVILGCSPAELLPTVPKEYQDLEEQLKKIDDEKTRKWGQELIKQSRD